MTDNRPQAPGAKPSYTERVWTLSRRHPFTTTLDSGPKLALGETVELVERSALVAEREAREKAEEALRTLTDAVGAAAVVHLVAEGPIRLIPDEWRAIEQAAIEARASLSALPAQKEER